MAEVTTREAFDSRIGALRDFMRDEYPEAFVLHCLAKASQEDGA